MEKTAFSPFEGDLFNRHKFAQNFEEFLLTEHLFVDGGLVVSLNASFGAGKTSFLEMWSKDLNRRHEAQNSLPKVITINAWETDYFDDPLVALVSELTEILEKTGTNTIDRKQASKLRETLADIGWFTVGAANSLVSSTLIVDAVAAGAFAKEKKVERAEKKKAPDIMEVFRGKKEALGRLKAILNTAFSGETPKVIVLIDELDRCRPDYAISYLETIKHVFDIHGIVFVLAVDEYQLRSAARALFGEINFDAYYRKFVHRRINLPSVDAASVDKMIQSYAKKYLSVEGKRVSMLGMDTNQLSHITDALRGIEPNPRQVQEIFRVMGHVLSSEGERDRRLLWCYGACAILLSAVSVVDQALFMKLTSRRVYGSELIGFVRSKGEIKKSDWWTILIVTGCGLRSEEIEEHLRGYGILGKNSTPTDYSATVGQFSRGWESYYEDETGSPIMKICGLIAEVKSFSKI